MAAPAGRIQPRLSKGEDVHYDSSHRAHRGYRPFLTGGPDQKKRVAETVNRACEDIGFYVITGHGVDRRSCDEMFAVSRAFFDLPLEEKLSVKRWAVDTPRGYSPLADESVSYSHGELSPGDLKESFSIGPVDPAAGSSFPESGPLAKNLWPSRPAELRRVWTAYFRTMERLAASLLRISAVGLGLPEDYFDQKIERQMSVLRVLYYPNQPEEPLPGQLRAGEHTDYVTITILRQENEQRPGGLQVCNRRGDWVDVPVVPDSFVINIGDMMELWTNDRWVSTMHRVLNPPRARALDSRRMSIAFFHEPNYDTPIECLPTCSSAENPPKYPTVLAGDYLRSKFTRQTSFAAERPTK